MPNWLYYSEHERSPKAFRVLVSTEFDGKLASAKSEEQQIIDKGMKSLLDLSVAPLEAFLRMPKVSSEPEDMKAWQCHGLWRIAFFVYQNAVWVVDYRKVKKKRRGNENDDNTNEWYRRLANETGKGTQCREIT